jgi:hypothetical protein
VTGLLSLWNDEARRHELGSGRASGCSEYYSWAAPARNALKAFRSLSMHNTLS